MLPLHKPSDLSDMAYERIKQSIMDLSLPPGEIIFEPRLARTLEISRTPVHEALIRLEHEDWIAQSDGQGYVVKPLTEESVRNIYEMRLLLEPYAAKLFVERADSAQVAAVSAPLDEIRSQVAAEQYDLYFEFHRRIHQAILDNCPNQVLKKALIALKEYMVRIRNFTGYNPRRHAPASLEEQRLFQDALHAMDGDMTALAMSNHIQAAQIRVLEQLAETLAAADRRHETSDDNAHAAAD